MGELVIVSGPPGAGKSTVAAALAARRDPSVLVEGDAFFRFLHRGRVDPWLTEAHGQNIIVGEAAAAATARFAAGPFWTIYDGVVEPWALETFTAMGAAPIHYVVLLPDIEGVRRPGAEARPARIPRRGGHPPHARGVRSGRYCRASPDPQCRRRP